MSTPFPKGPPRYNMRCPAVTRVEGTVAAIGRRLARCLEHKAPLSFRLFCGDADTATYLRLMLLGKGVQSVTVMSREQHRAQKVKKDARTYGDVGEGPVVSGTIPVSQLADLMQTMGPKAKPGAVVASAAPNTKSVKAASATGK